MNKRITIIDIGSHKLEELSILLKPGKHQVYIFIKWSLYRIKQAILQLLKLEVGVIKKINIYFKLTYQRAMPETAVTTRIIFRMGCIG